MSANKKPVGRQKSGLARAAALTPEQRSAIARKGGLARRGLKATHKGNFMKDFGIDVECYVLNDEKKTPVISQSGIAGILGMSARGSTFPKFISSETMAPFVGAELRAKLENVLKFQ